jgi:hypothetical protein
MKSATVKIAGEVFNDAKFAHISPEENDILLPI